MRKSTYLEPMYREYISIIFAAAMLASGAAMADHDLGVTLYRDVHFRGASQTYYDGDESSVLSGPSIGNDSVSSVRVDAGCRVTLYADVDFRGEAITLTEDVDDLRHTRFGNDRASSLAVECRRPGEFDDGSGWDDRPGVVLYSDENFRGREEAVYDDDPDLRDNPVGQDAVSSVRVAPGCRVVLYADGGFRGASTLLTDDTPSLRGAAVGNDRTSSLEVRCDGRSGGVTLYDDASYGGRGETFLRDDPQLRDNAIREDRVSSAKVAPGCVATLYEHPNYRGRSTTLRGDEPDLRRTSVGNDTVSSLRVDCRRSRRRR